MLLFNDDRHNDLRKDYDRDYIIMWQICPVTKTRTDCTWKILSHASFMTSFFFFFFFFFFYKIPFENWVYSNRNKFAPVGVNSFFRVDPFPEEEQSSFDRVSENISISLKEWLLTFWYITLVDKEFSWNDIIASVLFFFFGIYEISLSGIECQWPGLW